MPCSDCNIQISNNVAKKVYQPYPPADVERSSLCVDVSPLGDGSAVIDAFLVVAYQDPVQDCTNLPTCQDRYEVCRWVEDGYGNILLTYIVWPCSGATIPPPTCVATDIPLSECLMLTAFYTNNGGATWTDNSNWNTPIADNWYGITVTTGNTTSVNLSSNNVTGVFPSSFRQLVNLTDLQLYSNLLTGAIPTELGDLVNLTALQLGDNQLSGAIPTELGDLVNLTDLQLYSNLLTGAIPTELGDLVNLTVLHLGNNQLSGTIPTELGDLVNLTALQLGINQLTGTIPTELGGLVNLTVLQLFNNLLTGTIPTELGGLTNLTALRLDSNLLTGTIPTELGGLTNLTQLYLHTNQLTGAIPTELGDLTNLTDLRLQTNLLTGTNAFVSTLYANRITFNNSPFLDISNNSEALTGTYAAPPAPTVSDSNWTWNGGTGKHDPITGLAYVYALVNDPNADGDFNLWTITY